MDRRKLGSQFLISNSSFRPHSNFYIVKIVNDKQNFIFLFIPADMLNCEDPPLDICLVIDQTESVRQPNYIIMMDAAIDFVNFFTVDVNKTRFAIVSFAEYSTVRVHFIDAEYQSRANLSNFLNGMKNDILGRPTRTDRALESALQVLKESKGDRQGVLLVLTDGKTNKHSRDLGEVMNETRVSAIFTNFFTRA